MTDECGTRDPESLGCRFDSYAVQVLSLNDLRKITRTSQLLLVSTSRVPHHTFSLVRPFEKRERERTAIRGTGDAAGLFRSQRRFRSRRSRICGRLLHMLLGLNVSADICRVRSAGNTRLVGPNAGKKMEPPALYRCFGWSTRPRFVPSRSNPWDGEPANAARHGFGLFDAELR